MEAIRSSETSGTTQCTTRRHIPEEDTLQNHRCENLKSYKSDLVHIFTLAPMCRVVAISKYLPGYLTIGCDKVYSPASCGSIVFGISPLNVAGTVCHDMGCAL
jgi:hypothetical protein